MSAKILNKKVNFFIIGAQKCGTTSLAYALKNHPEVCFCDWKEPHYFSVSYRKSLDWYHSLFSPEEGQILGEASVRYTYDAVLRNIPGQIYAYNSEAKLIYIIRHPIERMISLYKDFQIRGRKVNEKFIYEVINNPEYILMSLYYAQIIPFLKFFKKDQVLFLNFNELAEKPDELYAKLASFLDISISGFSSFKKVQQNKSDGILHAPAGWNSIIQGSFLQILKRIVPIKLIETIKRRFYNVASNPAIDENEIQFILSLLRSDTENLEKLLGWDLSEWKKFNGIDAYQEHG